MKLRGITFAISLLAMSSASNAGSVTGYIDSVQAGRAGGGYFMVRVIGTPTDQPACATDQRFAVNPNNDLGKAMIAILISAQVSGRRVAITGTNTCDIVNGYESISYLRLLEN